MCEVDRIKELFLFDIIVAIAKIKYVASKFKNAEDLKYDFLHWDSIIREFEIVGEAMNYCIKFNLFENERDKRRVVDFRNILIHKYFGIDAEEVLTTAKESLDWLEDIVYNRISKINPDLKEELKKEMIEENKNFEFVIKSLEKIK